MSYWRTAGFSFVRYSNFCASVTRNALKEPMRTQAKNRDSVSLTIMQWANGKAPQPAAYISKKRENGNYVGLFFFFHSHLFVRLRSRR
jgi:F-type H+-transporting ATPase subunit epsilon